MKPGGGEVSPERTSLVVQLNPNNVPHNYAAVRGGRSQGTGTRHKLPLSPTAPRYLPIRNLSALARPLHVQQSLKIMSSPKKTAQEQPPPSDHDFMENVVEKRPKYLKNLPLTFQYVLLEHNYAAPQPTPTQLCSPIQVGTKAINNGIPVPPNGLTRGGLTQTLVPSSHHYHQYPVPRSYSRSLSSPVGVGPNAVSVSGGVSTLVPYRGAAPAVLPAQSQQLLQQPQLQSVTSLHSSMAGGGGSGLHHQQPTPDDESDLSSDGESAGGNRQNMRRSLPTGGVPSSVTPVLGPQDDGEETETAPEDEDSVTRCICDFQHDDGYMICCDKCLVWQHVDCMGIERGNIPDEYRCEECEPRKIDKVRAIRIQVSKRNQFNDSSDSLESAKDNTPPAGGRGGAGGRKQQSRSVSRGGSARKERGGKSGGGGRQWRQGDKKQTKHKGKQKPRRNTTNKKTEKKEAIAALERSPSPLPPAPQAGLNQLRQWIDSYEEAVTNHYSPELRARIAAIKTNGLHTETPKLSAMLPAVPKCKVSLLPTGIKILVTTAVVGANLPIIEVRGKYMLSKNASSPVGGGGVGSGGMTGGGNSASGNAANNNTKWTPYVFHHRLAPADHTTEICVDTTTYGNDARFIRRSCRPNAELRHCIEKGALHLYIVSTSHIESKTEITLPVSVGQFCSCGLADKCQASHVQFNNVQDKRRRGRRRTMSESSGAVGQPERSKAGSGSAAVNTGNHNIINNNNPSSKDKEANKRSYQQNTLPQRNIPSPPKVAKISPTSLSSPEPSPNSGANLTNSISSATNNQSNVNTNALAVATSSTSPPGSSNNQLPKAAAGSNAVTVAGPATGSSSTSSVTAAAAVTPPAVNSKVRGQAVSTRRATTPATRQEERKRVNNAASRDSNANPANANSSQMRSSSPSSTQPKQESSGKMTREERKMEAIMKAIERLEKDEARKQQTSSGNSSGGSVSGSNLGGRARKTSLSVSPHRERYERQTAVKKKTSRAVRETRSSKSNMRTRRGKQVQVTTRRAASRRNNVMSNTNVKRNTANNKNANEDDEQEDEDDDTGVGVDSQFGNSNHLGSLAAPPAENTAGENNTAAVSTATSPRSALGLRRTTRRNAGLKLTTALVTPTSQPLSPDTINDCVHYKDEMEADETSAASLLTSHTPELAVTNGAHSSSPGSESVPSEQILRLPLIQPLQLDTPSKMDTQSSSSSHVTSQNSLLVTTAGSLAPGFKFPRTKKQNYMNSWFGNEAPQSNPQATVATVIGSYSPPRAVQGLAPDCAKKRWLRQAISEDSDSPKQAEAISPTEMAAPLKKRRFARESVSSEHSFTPPATPVTEHVTQIFEDEENSVTSPTELNSSSSLTIEENHHGVDTGGKINESVNGPRTPPTLTDPPLDPTDDYEGLRREMSAAYNLLAVNINTTLPSSQRPLSQAAAPPPPPPPPLPAPPPPPVNSNSNNSAVAQSSPSPQQQLSPQRLSAPSTPTSQQGDEPLTLQQQLQSAASVKEEARVKRKLSISEYRERLKSNPDKRTTSTESLNSTNITNGPNLSNSQSSGTEEEEEEDIDSPDFLRASTSLYSATASISAVDHHGAFKKGAGNVTKFSPAPTQLEQEREGLSDRLRREFGLFVSDDEDDRLKRNALLNQAVAAAAAASGMTSTGPPELVPVSLAKRCSTAAVVARGAIRNAGQTASTAGLGIPVVGEPWIYYPPPPPPPSSPPPAPPPLPPPAPPSTVYHSKVV